MPWLELTFGKHTGKTLPWVVFSDPDWFFWAIEAGIFDNKAPELLAEAKVIANRARRIKVPKNERGNLQVEYYMVPGQGFARLQIVERARPVHDGASPTVRSGFLDLGIARTQRDYDKRGNRDLSAAIKTAIFGTSRVTGVKLEAFFSDVNNFG